MCPPTHHPPTRFDSSIHSFIHSFIHSLTYLPTNSKQIKTGTCIYNHDIEMNKNTVKPWMPPQPVQFEHYMSLE